MILGDGMLGQMMEPIIANRISHIAYRNDKRLAISDKQKKWALSGCKGRAPNVVKSFCMREGELEKLNLLLQKKYQLIRDKEQRCETIFLDDARVVLVVYGTMARIAGAVVRKLREKGKKIGLIRPITLWPFPVKAFRPKAQGPRPRTFLVIEMSYGQMLEDVRLAIDGKARVAFLGRSGGGIPTEEEIIKACS